MVVISILLAGCPGKSGSMSGAQFQRRMNSINYGDQAADISSLTTGVNGAFGTFPTSSAVNSYIDSYLTMPSCSGDISVDRPEAPVGARMYPTALKNHPRPSRGCIPVENISLQEARRAMSLQNVTTDGATELEERTLGVALVRIQQLNGGPLESGKWSGRSPYPFRIRDGGGTSRQAGDHILIRRKSHGRGALSVAQHVHEYAHLVGNNGGYNAYRSYMGGNGNCMVSGYADNNPNEHFAEVFTAFVTEPNLFNTSSPTAACRKAFEFFRGWFGDGDRVAECM